LICRWEEEKPSDGTKWTYLEHKGPVFAPLYEPLPDSVKFYYNGKQVRLSESAEEIAGFYAKMLEHEFTTKKTFNDNFFKDWRKSMTSKEKEMITDLSLCNFKPMCAYFQQKSEERKAMTKEEKLVCTPLLLDAWFSKQNAYRK
jgi:DNA topoisomerase I